LRAANSQVLDVKGQIKVNIKYLDKVYKLPLVISDDKLPTPLIGRDWLDVMVRMWRNQIISQQSVLAIRQDLMSLSVNSEIFIKFPNILSESKGPIKKNS